MNGKPSNAPTANDKTNNTPTALGRLLDGLRDLLDWSVPVADDPDLANRRQVYDHVAAFLGERLGCPPTAVLAAVHRLCGERDETLLAEAGPYGEALLDQARTLLLAVRVQYLFEDSRQARRVTLITFLTDDRPAERRVIDVLDWDLLPRGVRRERLRLGATQLAFQLYPGGDALNP